MLHPSHPNISHSSRPPPYHLLSWNLGAWGNQRLAWPGEQKNPCRKVAAGLVDEVAWNFGCPTGENRGEQTQAGTGGDGLLGSVVLVGLRPLGRGACAEPFPPGGSAPSPGEALTDRGVSGSIPTQEFRWHWRVCTQRRRRPLRCQTCHDQHS